MKMRRDTADIGRMQIAGVSERHEPDIGEINSCIYFAWWMNCIARGGSGVNAGQKQEHPPGWAGANRG